MRYYLQSVSLKPKFPLYAQNVPFTDKQLCCLAMVSRDSGSPKSPGLELGPSLPLPRPWISRFKAPDPTSLGSAGFETTYPCACQMAKKERQSAFMICLTPSIVCQSGDGGTWKAWAVQSRDACPTASQSWQPELALERPWPHLARTLYLCPRHKRSLVLAPAAPIPHAPDCPSPSAPRKAHFVKSKD